MTTTPLPPLPSSSSSFSTTITPPPPLFLFLILSSSYSSYPHHHLLPSSSFCLFFFSSGVGVLQQKWWCYLVGALLLTLLMLAIKAQAQSKETRLQFSSRLVWVQKQNNSKLQCQEEETLTPTCLPILLWGNFCEHLYMGTQPGDEYAAFEDKVKRTVYLEDLSPAVTAAVIKTAFGQFGNVVSVQYIPNYNESQNIPLCALVEMESPKDAKAIVSEMKNYPFMMSGMPRPIRARAAEEEMFVDRPRKPGRKIQCRWVDPKDPDFEVAKKLKVLARKHSEETSLLLKCQLEEEEELAKEQGDVLKANYKKYELIDNLTIDGTVYRLARHYNLNVSDD